MLIKEEQPLWNWYGTTYWLFPNVRLSKQFKFKFGENFYKDTNRYGGEEIILKFPLSTRFLKKNNNIILVQSDDHTTHLVWSQGKLLLYNSNNSNSLKVHTVKDFNNFHIIECYYNLISAPKNTTVKLRDEHEEMELVF